MHQKLMEYKDSLEFQDQNKDNKDNKFPIFTKVTEILTECDPKLSDSVVSPLSDKEKQDINNILPAFLKYLDRKN